MNSASDLQANDTPTDDQEKETPDSKPDLQAIVAVPLSFKLSHDDTVVTPTSSGRKRRSAETPEGWICEARTRKNGVVDKFYYHKETNVRCRSLKEVERYTLHGIHPGPRSKGREKEIIIADAEQIRAMEAKEKFEENHPGTETRGVSGGKNKGKSKIHEIPLNKNEYQLVENVLAEAWHNMLNPTDIRTEAWQEMEARLKEAEKEEIMEKRLQEEREKMIRKFKEELKELERKFEEERAQLHQWMKDEIDYRIQLRLDAMIPNVLQQEGKKVPPTSGDSAGI